MTERLFDQDWRRLEFEACIVALRPAAESTEIELDCTAFFPTGGGQPHDTGRLQGEPVQAVYEDPETGAVWHTVAGLKDWSVGQRVKGRVDWQRRLEHTQQHSGQHILSQALQRVAGRSTEGFHLGSETCSIDLDGEVSATLLQQAESLANQVLFENRPVRVHHVAPQDLERFSIRRPAAGHPDVRLIEIADFDTSTCCGTHVQHTAEVGLILVTGTEKVRQRTRVGFAAGWRALAEHRHNRIALEQVGRALGASRERMGDLAAQLADSVKTLGKRLQKLAHAAARAEAVELAAEAPPQRPWRVLAREYPDRSLDELLALAQALSAQPALVAVLGNPRELRLIMSCAADVELSAGSCLKEVLARSGGRGGGSTALAQGMVPGEGYAAAWAALQERVRPTP